MDNLNFYYNIVENAITKIGLDPQKTRAREAGKWSITKANIPVWIEVVFHQSENRAYFQVAAPIMKLPTENWSAITLDLLETNNLLYGVAFCVNKGNVFIKTLREAEGLDLNEAHSMIMRVGNYAEFYRKALQKKYPDRAPIN